MVSSSPRSFAMEKEVLGDDLEAIRIRVVTGIASEHPAPKVDRRIRFIEGIPFNTPKEWLKYLVLFGVTRFNLLPHSPPWTGASPGELFTVTFVGMSVGEYVQCEVASPDNSMNVRTLSCIPDIQPDPNQEAAGSSSSRR
jgi:hypothetical protein